MSEEPRSAYARYCKMCENLLDAETNVEVGAKVQPKPGDTSICLYCGAVYQYLEGFRTHRVPEEALADEFTPEQLQTIRQTQQLCRVVQERRQAESN